MRLDHETKELLMELQYDFPITRRPFEELGRRLGKPESWVIERTRELVKARVIRRIGALVNYRARGLVAALVGVKVPNELVDPFARAVNEDPMVTHNFLRDYPHFNVWYVTKALSRDELEEKVRGVTSRFGISESNYVILYSIRTYKVDVKFDVMRGVSRAKRTILPAEVPPIESTGLPREFFNALKSININPEPFNKVAEVAGVDADDLPRIIDDLRRRGIIRDFYATLDPEGIGFRENAMTVFETSRCEDVANIDEATHVVNRITVPGKWPYNCYFMIHGVDRKIIEETVRERLLGIGVGEFRLLYSLRNLLTDMATRVEAT
jgi:DNA-binding Lrp family transcriptional regulator